MNPQSGHSSSGQQVGGPSAAQSAEGAPKAAPPPPVPMRCVIWHGATAELPGELLNSLSKRMLRMTVCTDAYSAAAHCAMIERTRQAELKAGSVQPLGGVLVLVQPTQLARVRETVESLHLYGPSIAVWVYDRGANPKLRAVVEEDVVSWGPRMPASPLQARPAAFSPAPAPSMATPARPRPMEAAATNGETRARRTASLLSEEELRMLLAPDPRTGERRNGRGSA